MEIPEYFKEIYYKEHERRNEINNSLSTPIGLIGALVAAHFFLTTNFDYSCSDFTTYVFVLFTLLSCSFLIYSIINLIRAYTGFSAGYEYDYLADAGEIENYIQALKLYYSNTSNADALIKNDFDEYLSKAFTDATDKNQKKNKLKSKARYICLRFLIWSFISLCLSLIPFIYNYATKPTKIPTIKIESPALYLDSLNRIGIFTKNPEMKSIESNNPQKPTPPPNQTIKEGQNPKPQSPPPNLPPKPVPVKK